MKQRIHLDYYGRVQNCGFRWHCKQCAGKAGVTGWAENDSYDLDHVTCEVQGSPEAVELFQQLVLQGNGYCRIERVEKTDARPKVFEMAFGMG